MRFESKIDTKIWGAEPPQNEQQFWQGGSAPWAP